MILKALCDYYDRKRGSLPGFGTDFVEISFAVIIDDDGVFVRFEDLRDGKKKRGKRLEVRRPVVRSSGIKPNYLYDNGGYVLALPDTSKQAKKEGVETQKQKAFHEKILKALEKEPDNPILRSIDRFISGFDSPATQEKMQADPIWKDVTANAAKNFTFMMDHDFETVAEKQKLIRLDKDEEESAGPEMICLITGEHCHPVELTASTMIPGGKSSAKIVSFQTSQGYDSYGKSKCYNAPISPEAEFKFSTALKDLLRPESKNKFTLANRTFLYWASCSSEETMSALMTGMNSMFASQDDSPECDYKEMTDVFMSIYSGRLKTSGNDRFYILGLSPNAARIAVTYWAEIPVKEFARNILRHLEDMDIDFPWDEGKPYAGLYHMVAACITEKKVSENKSRMPDLIAESIFNGTKYPVSMLTGCLNRLRAFKPLTRTRAGMLKAYLNRNSNNQHKITKMLDTESTNRGYLLGRLFAVLARIQFQANGTNSIKERYMSSASINPAAVFPTLLRLSIHHQKNLKKSSEIFFEKFSSEIMDKMGSTMPAILSIEEQASFFLGYKQQDNVLIKSKEKPDDEGTTEE